MLCPASLLDLRTTLFSLPLGLAIGGCTDPVTPTDAGVLTVSKEQQASWVRNFNPLVAEDLSRWPTRGGIYEPLLVFNTIRGEYVPWLATEHAWSDGGETLRFDLRPGVLWSDGEAFTAEDVVFTFELLRENPAIDLNNTAGFVSSVEATGERGVVFHLSKPFVPGLGYIAHQPIVPEHVWRNVEDPVTFANPDPVATGPFTEVDTFRDQLYVLGRNPRYWQPGKPAVKALRFPALPSNDQATLGLLRGEVDWAGNFVPAIDRVFTERDPEHHRYWFPLVGNTVMLYPNNTRPGLDDPAVRKALSRAIDRSVLAEVAMFDYTRPADATGLSDAYTSYRSEDAVEAGDWVQHDPARALEELAAAGYTRDDDGRLRRPNGEPFTLELNVVNGWSDWVRAAQIISRQLDGIGVNVSVKTYDFSAWFDRLQRGDYDLCIAWSIQGPSPYIFYRNLLSSKQRLPVGQPAASNWHRFASEPTDALLAQLESALEPDDVQRLTHELELAFVDAAPVIPLFLGPSWGSFNTSRFTGFPNADDPYAKLSPNETPETLLVLTQLKPR